MPGKRSNGNDVTYRVVALELVRRAVASVRKPSCAVDFIRSVLTIFVAIANERLINAVVATATELVREAAMIFCTNQRQS